MNVDFVEYLWINRNSSIKIKKLHSKEVQKTCEKLIIWKSDVNYQINIKFVGEMALPVEFPSRKKRYLSGFKWFQLLNAFSKRMKRLFRKLENWTVRFFFLQSLISIEFGLNERLCISSNAEKTIENRLTFIDKKA